MSLLSNFLKRSQSPKSPAPGAHMTWASRTISGGVTMTRDFLNRRVWARPIIAVTVLLALGWGVHGSIERTMNSNLRSQLQTLLDVEVAMLRTWLAAQESNAQSVTGDTEVRLLISQLLAAKDDGENPTDNIQDNVQDIAKQLAKQLGPAMNSHGYDRFFVADRKKILAATHRDAVGLELPSEFESVTERIYDGLTTVTPPFASVLTLSDTQGRAKTGVSSMFVIAPIVDEHLQVVASLGLQINPKREFTRIMQLGRLGESGETYAFNDKGLMLSNSRFDNDLILLGLLPDREGISSILEVQVRAPGGDMTQGYRPGVRRAALPLTRMAESAIAGGSKVDTVGYSDYRGVTVVGAWTWLEEYGLGVATEIDYSEAFRPLTILKRTFWGLIALLVASSIAIFIFSIRVAQLQRKAMAATIEAKQLGQYKLEKKLGEGAMGMVYRGKHAMLARPTAIKLIDADKVTESSIASFEREVQITSNLNHPNTIEIYDFGRTPEGVFYYAMEFLDGLDLQELVDRYGPQPPSRVIYILRQICGSLYEAHSMGLVHRDIKPANIMLNRRGGEGDVVKVLDFGLVKAFEGEHADNRDHSMAGTPLYMSPEAIQMPGSVDACSDLYAVGAVGYFLLTGHPVFEANELAELCRMHAADIPQPPSTRVGKKIPEGLENAILGCLEKTRSKRPQTARDLANMLNRSEEAHAWTVDDADAWWGRHERGQIDPADVAKPSISHDETIMHDS